MFGHNTHLKMQHKKASVRQLLKVLGEGGEGLYGGIGHRRHLARHQDASRGRFHRQGRRKLDYATTKPLLEVTICLITVVCSLSHSYIHFLIKCSVSQSTILTLQPDQLTKLSCRWARVRSWAESARISCWGISWSPRLPVKISASFRLRSPTWR